MVYFEKVCFATLWFKYSTKMLIFYLFKACRLKFCVQEITILIISDPDTKYSVVRNLTFIKSRLTAYNPVFTDNDIHVNLLRKSHINLCKTSNPRKVDPSVPPL